jgi:hypothetical protein
LDFSRAEIFCLRQNFERATAQNFYDTLAWLPKNRLRKSPRRLPRRAKSNVRVACLFPPQTPARKAGVFFFSGPIAQRIDAIPAR